MVDVFLQDVWLMYRINKDEDDESLPLLGFWRDVVDAIILKYSKEGRFSSSQAEIRNFRADVCYDDAKHYRVESQNQGKCKLWEKNSWHHNVKFTRSIFDIFGWY